MEVELRTATYFLLGLVD